MEDYRAVVQRVAGSVLLDDAHDAADELHKRGQARKDAEDCGHGQVGMVEAFTEHAYLDDDVEFVALQFG